MGRGKAELVSGVVILLVIDVPRPALLIGGGAVHGSVSLYFSGFQLCGIRVP